MRRSGELSSFLAVAAAIFATMLVAYLCLVFADRLTKRLGPISAAPVA
jgi:multiple antibiotic resistance protein